MSEQKKSIAELAEDFVRIKTELEDAKYKQAQLQKEWDEIRKHLIPQALEDAGLDSVKVKGIGTVSLRTDAYASVKEGCKEDLYRWLKENDHGDLIQATVNSSTLKAFLKEQVKEGNEIPDEFVNFTPYEYASITKR